MSNFRSQNEEMSDFKKKWKKVENHYIKVELSDLRKKNHVRSQKKMKNDV